MNRFKMNFSNKNDNLLMSQLIANRQMSIGQKMNTNSKLNAPMVDRIHKAKPGCSACGKKVM